MKIQVVQDYLRNGGTERQSVFLSNAFAAAGHDTTLISFRPGGRLRATLSPGVRQRILQTFDARLDWFAPGLTRAIVGDTPDVVLSMGRMANCYAGGLQRAATTAAVVATMRTGKSLPWLFRRSLQTCRHVVANSREARDTLVTRYGVPADRITVIYNSLVFAAVDSDAGHGERETLRSQHGATTATTVLLCVAMFRPEKNQRELIEIVAGLPADAACQLWLAGDGPARAECERLVAERQLGDRVKFVGFHRDPSPLYRAADIAVHASWSESLSNFLIEAQAHGLPAVAYNAQGISECFVPGRTGWAIARDDRNAFRSRLLELMREDAAARRARSEAARTYARTTFDPARQVEAYLDLFSRLQGTEGVRD